MPDCHRGNSNQAPFHSPTSEVRRQGKQDGHYFRVVLLAGRDAVAFQVKGIASVLDPADGRTVAAAPVFLL